MTKTVKTVVVEETKRSELAFNMLLALEKLTRRLANPGAWDFAKKEARHAYAAVLPLLDEAAAAFARDERWAPRPEDEWPSEIRARVQDAADVMAGEPVAAFAVRRFGYCTSKENSQQVAC
jgi:hypothetical protein